MQSYLIVLLVAVAATAISVPPLRRLSVRTGQLAQPGDRTVHATPTPILGGGALLIGLLAALAVASRMSEFEPVFDAPGNLIGVVAASVVMWLTGLIDDVRDVSPVSTEARAGDEVTVLVAGDSAFDVGAVLYENAVCHCWESLRKKPHNRRGGVCVAPYWVAVLNCGRWPPVGSLTERPPAS